MDNLQHAVAQARGALTRLGSKRLALVSLDFVYRFHLDWKELEDQIENLQASKKSMLANIGAPYERRQAEALKIKMRRALMGKEDWAAQAVFIEMAGYYIGHIETEIDARVGEPDLRSSVDERRQ